MIAPDRRLWLRHRADVLALLGLGLLGAVQLWAAAGPGRLPQNLDLMLQYVPNAAYLARSLGSGHVPLWNPYQGTGMPFAADPGTGAWYLPNWLPLLILPLYTAVRLVLWAHLLWAAAGMYVYLRVAGRVGVAAAWIGAAAYALTTWLPGLAGMAAVLSTVAWLPWVALFAHLAVRRGTPWAALLGVAGALQLLAGWPAGAYLTWLAAGWLALSEAPWRSWSRVLLGAVCAATLAGVLLVPALEFVGETNYAQTRPLERVGSEGYLTLLSWFRPAGGTGSLESSQLYLGVAPVVLALVGVTFGRRDRWRYGALALLSLLVAFGTHGPLFGALYRWLPGFRIVYLPARLGVVAAFALACLAALGMERLSRGEWRLRDAMAIAALVAALPFLLLGQFWLSEGYDNFRRLLTNLGRATGGPYLTRGQEAQYAVFGVLSLLVLLWAALRPSQPSTSTTPAKKRTGGRVGVAGLLVALTGADLVLAQILAQPAGFDPGTWYAPARASAAELHSLVGSDRLTGLQWHGTQHFLNDFPTSAQPALLPPNLGMLVGVKDAAAYNPLLLRRAAAYFDEVTLGQKDDHWLWLDDFQSPAARKLALRGVLSAGEEWRVLDRRLSLPVRLPPDGTLQTIWSGSAAPTAVSTAPSAGSTTGSADAKRLRVISYLGEATTLPQGTPAIELRLRTSEGEEQQVVLRAGVETAEWAYGRADVRGAVRHLQAPVALETRLQGAVEGRFEVYEYWALEDVTLSAPLAEIRGRSLVPGITGFVDGIYVEPAAAPETQPLASGAEWVSPGGQQARATLAGASATIDRDEAERIDVRTSSQSAGTLVLADAFYPGWTATVDGRPVAISPQDGLFRAVAVPAGEHTVIFRYRPRSLLLGAALSAIGLGLMAGLLLVSGSPGSLLPSIMGQKRPPILARRPNERKAQ